MLRIQSKMPRMQALYQQREPFQPLPDKTWKIQSVVPCGIAAMPTEPVAIFYLSTFSLFFVFSFFLKNDEIYFFSFYSVSVVSAM